MQKVNFQASDGYTLQGTLYPAGTGAPVVVVNSATAVPQRFYRRFSEFMQRNGVTALTYDYRGIGASAPQNLRGFKAHLGDWGTKDIQAAVDFAEAALAPSRIYMMGHSAGGQQAGLIRGAERITAMVTVSAQSGYWRLQGGVEKPKVWFLTTLFIPILTRLFGYFPWRYFGGQDLPYDVALEWAAWCKTPGYLLDDETLPLHRFNDFQAPILAFSVDDDNWGTQAAVAAMMRAYPNVISEHLVPKDFGLQKMGHMGFFRDGADPLWQKTLNWYQSKG